MTFVWRADNNLSTQFLTVLISQPYTEAYWKIDLHNLFHFLALRMDINAQHEIRSYANIIGNEIVSKWCPISWEAFKEYRLNSSWLSEIEVNVLRHFIDRSPIEAKKYLMSLNLLSFEADKIKRSREVIELEEKLRRFGVEVNWKNY